MNESFRSSIVKRDYNCLITGFHSDTCDSAHIIPASVCYSLGLKDDLENANNGLLLCKSLHGSFDRYLWTFDPFDQIVDDQNDIFLSIIVSKPRVNLLINHYRVDSSGGKLYYKIERNCLPYLYVHYLVWTHVFPTVPPKKLWNTKVPELTLYKNVLKSFPFFIWRNHVDGLIQLLREKTDTIWTIVKYSLFSNRYLVLCQGHSWDQAIWVNRESVPKELLDRFHWQKALLNDVDYSPDPCDEDE